MKRTVKALSVVVAGTGLSMMAVGFGCYLSGARINTSESIPVGLYWTTAQPIQRGGYVMFCPPNEPVFAVAMKRGYIGSGFCDGGYGYMMKRVLAAKSDAVAINSDGVFVNGVKVPYSTPLGEDGAGRLLPRYSMGRRVMKENELLLMSDVCPASFDARYFGPVDRKQIKWAIRPVITW
jgi:conjugative transfer signal peptidase TraF